MQFDVFSVHAPPHARSWRWMALWACVCAVVGCLSLWSAPEQGDHVRIWLASPIGAMALLHLPRQQWSAMLLALTLAMGLALWVQPGSGVGGAAVQYPLLLCALLAGLLVLEIALAAWLLAHLPELAQAEHSISAQTLALLRGAVLPALCTAPLAGVLGLWVLQGQGAGPSAAPAPDYGAAIPTPMDWLVQSLNWMLAHTIGAVALLPLALAVSTQGVRSALRALRDPLALGLLLVCLGLSWAVVHSLPKPLVLLVAPLLLMAVRASHVAAFAANALTAVSIAAFMQLGLVTPPPSTTLWGLLFYLSVFATLLPGLYVAVAAQEQRQARAALALNEARALDLYLHTPAMLHTIDADGLIVKVSLLWLHALGYRENEVLGWHIADFLAPESARLMREELIPQSLRTGRCDNIEYQLRRRDGSLCDVQMSAVWEYDSAQRPWRCLAVLQDLTEKKQLLARSHFAEHDPLTGLPNRVLLNDRLKMLCALHARHGGNFAVGFLDLDHFKQINDVHGHDAGDVLLKTIAQRLTSALRASDTVCRIGGDEFVMLFSEMEGQDELLYLTDKLMQRIVQPCKLGTDDAAPVVSVSASLGLTLFPAQGTDPQTLLARADQAMYEAKHKGRNRREIFSTDEQEKK